MGFLQARKSHPNLLLAWGVFNVCLVSKNGTRQATPFPLHVVALIPLTVVYTGITSTFIVVNDNYRGEGCYAHTKAWVWTSL